MKRRKFVSQSGLLAAAATLTPMETLLAESGSRRVYADLVMLGQDPHEVEPEQINNIPVLRTIVDGRTVFEV